MAEISVEMELVSAVYDSVSGKVDYSVRWNLINDANQNVLATRTVNEVLEYEVGIFDAKELMRRTFDQAMAWGYFMLSVNQLSNLIGQKIKHRIT